MSVRVPPVLDGSYEGEPQGRVDEAPQRWEKESKRHMICSIERKMTEKQLESCSLSCSLNQRHLPQDSELHHLHHNSSA